MKPAEKIPEKMSGMSKPRFKFMIVLFTTVLCLRGKMNFRNMSRYSDLSEKTFSRNFRKSFDFLLFSRLVIEETANTPRRRFAAMDCTFVQKSGDATYGPDYFWNGSADKTEKGLGLSVIAIVDADSKTAFTLSAMQTSDPHSEKIPNHVGNFRDRNNLNFKNIIILRKYGSETRIGFHLSQLRMVRHSFPEDVRYLVADGYYAKEKFVTGVTDEGLHVIGKSRCDANLRYLYNGPRREGPGAPRKYDGKVDFQDIGRMEFIGEPEKGIFLYTAVVNSVSLKRNIRIAYLLDTRNKKRTRYALLFSTDIGTDAEDIVHFYKARFQMEFIFRDAEQFTGLCDCQARKKESLHFHFNASLPALNLVRAEDRESHPGGEPAIFPMASHKVRYFNEFLIDKFISMSGLDQNPIKNTPAYEELRNYGAIAA